MGTRKTAISMRVLANDVCDDVKIEPCLHTLQGEFFPNRSTNTDVDARLDIKANGLFDLRFNRAFFVVKMINPYSEMWPRSIPVSYKYHESIKKLKYEQGNIEGKKASFCQLTFLCSRGAGPSASKATKKLALRISKKKKYS